VNLRALDAVQSLPDMPDGLTGRSRTGTALLDHRHDDVVLVVRREPAGRLLVVYLGSTGLGTDLDLVEGEPLHLPGVRAVLGRALERPVDVAQRRLRDRHIAYLLRTDLLHQVALRIDHGLTDARLPDGPAVGERPVRDRQLDRGDDRVALPAHEVDGVARAVPVTVEADLVRVLRLVATGIGLLQLLVALAVVPLHLLVVVLLPRGIGDPAVGLTREVDSGFVAQAELACHVGEYGVGIGARGRAAGLEPQRVPDTVEERVARDLQRLVETDHPVRLGLVVLEGLIAYLEGVRAVQSGVGAEPVRERPGRHHRFPGRTGRQLRLRRPRQQGFARLLGVQPLELVVGDTSDPDRRIVGRVARHRDHTTVVRVEDDHRARRRLEVAARDLVVGAPRLHDRLA